MEKKRHKSLYEKLNAREVVKTTEEDKYRSLTFFFDVCDSCSVEAKITREEAARLFSQIKELRNKRYREELFSRLEKYVGMMYDDNKKCYQASLISDEF